MIVEIILWLRDSQSVAHARCLVFISKMYRERKEVPQFRHLKLFFIQLTMKYDDNSHRNNKQPSNREEYRNNINNKTIRIAMKRPTQQQMSHNQPTDQRHRRIFDKKKKLKISREERYLNLYTCEIHPPTHAWNYPRSGDRLDVERRDRLSRRMIDYM